MNFIKRAAFCYAAPLLTICSVATTQLKAQCDPSPCSIDWCSLLVPALVGAAAGAATGAAVNSRGKHGKEGERGEQGEHGPHGPQGERGPPGDNPFIRDIHNSITFNFEINSITFVTPPTTPGILTPYVTSPDGQITTSGTIPFNTTGTASSTAVTLASPFFGDYVFGLELPSIASNVTIVYTLTISPTHRNPTTYSGSTTLTAQDEHFQLPFNFTYGSLGTVPSI